MHTALADGEAIADSFSGLTATNVAPPIDVTALFCEHHSNLTRFIRRYVRTNEDAEDVVQNTFLEAIRCADHFSGLSKPSTWLFGIALNLARNQIRRSYTDLSENVSHTILESMANLVADPFDLSEQREIACRIETTLASLPPKIRETFEAVFGGECTYEEAAATLQIPLGTVRSRISRVRATLRRDCGMD